MSKDERQAKIHSNEIDGYGQWMVVTRKKKAQKPRSAEHGEGLLPRVGSWKPATEGTASVRLVCTLTTRKLGRLIRLQRLLEIGRAPKGGKRSKVVKLIGQAVTLLVQEEKRQC